MQTGKVAKQSSDDKINAASIMEGANRKIKDYSEESMQRFNQLVKGIARREFFASVRKATGDGVITVDTIRRAFSKTNHFSFAFVEERLDEKNEDKKERDADVFTLVGTFNGSNWYMKENDLTRPCDYWSAVNSYVRFNKAIAAEQKKTRKRIDEIIAPVKQLTSNMLSFGAGPDMIFTLATNDGKNGWLTLNLVKTWCDNNDLTTAEYLEILKDLL